MWFIAQQEGEYDLFCAEYCGERHSYMLSKVKVIPETEYIAWLDKSDVPADEHPGLTLMKQNACITCHSLDGSKIIGPSFKGIYGHEVEVITETGEEKTVMVDDEYIKNSLYEPNKEVVKGFNKGMMISYKEQLNEEQVRQITEFIKTLK
jgi:cytochrome c oxidase subunit 2